MGVYEAFHITQFCQVGLPLQVEVYRRPTDLITNSLHQRGLTNFPRTQYRHRRKLLY